LTQASFWLTEREKEGIKQNPRQRKKKTVSGEGGLLSTGMRKTLAQTKQVCRNLSAGKRKGEKKESAFSSEKS